MLLEPWVWGRRAPGDSKLSISGVGPARGHMSDTAGPERNGIVTMATAEPAHLYSLNRDHLAAPYIVGLCQSKNQLRQRVTELVQRWSVPAEAVILFGSAARGERRPASDIDLFVVRPDSVDEDVWLEQVAELAERVSTWTGNDARVVEMTPEEARDGLHEGDGLLRSIRDEGQVLFATRGIGTGSAGPARGPADESPDRLRVGHPPRTDATQAEQFLLAAGTIAEVLDQQDDPRLRDPLRTRRHRGLGRRLLQTDRWSLQGAGPRRRHLPAGSGRQEGQPAAGCSDGHEGEGRVQRAAGIRHGPKRRLCGRPRLSWNSRAISDG